MALPVVADTSQTLDGWRTVGSLIWRSPDTAKTILLASGVPEADLTVYVNLLRPITGDGDEKMAYALSVDLTMLAESFPDLSVRAGLGWCLRVAHRHGVDDSALTVNEAAPWAYRGLGEYGWLFAAAGLSMTEAEAISSCGDEDEWAGVWLLAGLSGAPLPSGPAPGGAR